MRGKALFGIGVALGMVEATGFGASNTCGLIGTGIGIVSGFALGWVNRFGEPSSKRQRRRFQGGYQPVPSSNPAPPPPYGGSGVQQRGRPF